VFLILWQFARTSPTAGAAKTLLQGVALVPGLGTASSVALLAIDVAQGDYAGTVGNALGLIPIGGGELAAGSRLAREASAIEREAREVGIIENAVRTCGAGSFTAGTSVLTDKGSRPIEDIKVGERVLSRDEQTGAQDWHFVMGTTVNKEPVYKLNLHSQKESAPQDELGVSAEHPFWVKGKGWTAAEELKSDSEVLNAHGEWLQVGSFESQTDEQITYNLSVEGGHSFFVGENQAWVHNNPGCGIIGKPQVTGTPGHPELQLSIAQTLADSGQYRNVYISRSYSTVARKEKIRLGTYGRKIPDIIGVRNNGVLDAFEVASRTDTVAGVPQALFDRNDAVITKLGSSVKGTLTILFPGSPQRILFHY
jgi:hypothetical protein